MNLIGFIRLMKMIYGKGPIDLDFIQSQGLLAVKIGQIHALRIDFLDPEKCKQLAQLYRHTSSLPPESFKELIATNAPEGFLDHFEYLDEVPFASASVGQVHRGRLTTGQDVAVKLVKKDFTRAFRKDVRAVELFFRVLISFYPRIKRVANPLGILEDIKRYTLSELDLRNEVRGQETLAAYYEQYKGAYDLTGLHFLAMYKELSNESVLVSEYVQGETLDELLDAGRLDYQMLLHIFNIVGVYMFRVGTFHGDIHPGNIMVRNGDELVFVDNGSLGYVEGKIKSGLFDFFDALSHYDFHVAARCLNRMSERELSGEEYGRFESAFLGIYKGFEGKSVSEVSLTRQMMLTIKLGVNSGMEFDKGMFSVVRALMYLDGMVLRCNPDAVLMDDIQKFVDGFKQHE
jgi:ubiquinone biosynthesis protein